MLPPRTGRTGETGTDEDLTGVERGAVLASLDQMGVEKRVLVATDAQQLRRVVADTYGRSSLDRRHRRKRSKTLEDRGRQLGVDVDGVVGIERRHAHTVKVAGEALGHSLLHRLVEAGGHERDTNRKAECDRHDSGSARLADEVGQSQPPRSTSAISRALEKTQKVRSARGHDERECEEGHEKCDGCERCLPRLERALRLRQDAQAHTEDRHRQQHHESGGAHCRLCLLAKVAVRELRGHVHSQCATGRADRAEARNANAEEQRKDHGRRRDVNLERESGRLLSESVQAGRDRMRDRDTAERADRAPDKPQHTGLEHRATDEDFGGSAQCRHDRELPAAFLERQRDRVVHEHRPDSQREQGDDREQRHERDSDDADDRRRIGGTEHTVVRTDRRSEPRSDRADVGPRLHLHVDDVDDSRTREKRLGFR